MSKGSETRARIVEKAASLFNQHGFEGSSMAELMKATGLEKGGIYRHFSSKEELAVAAFDYAWNQATATRIDGLGEVRDAVDRLKQSVTNFVDKKPAIPGGCPLLNTAIEADDGSDVLRDCAVKALRQWRSRLMAIVREGIERDEIRQDADPKSVATILISSLEGALMISRLEQNREALRTAQAYLNTYLETVRKRGRD